MSQIDKRKRADSDGTVLHWHDFIFLLLRRAAAKQLHSTQRLRVLIQITGRMIHFILRPMAAFSSGELIQYPYLAAILKSSWISSAVGGLID